MDCFNQDDILTVARDTFFSTKNSHITCHDIADYLEVLQIVFRESKHFDRKDGSGCIIVVHRMEELQLTRERELGLCLVKGMTRGRGKTWYEVEVS